MRLLRLIAVLGAGVLALAACSGSADGSDEGVPADGPRGTLLIAAAEEPDALDFMASTQGNVHFRTLNMVEPLFAFDDDWAPQPMLAEDVEISDDHTSYRITLRDVTLHNGDPLTSADVVASLKRWMEVDGRSRNWLSGLQSLEPDGDRAVVLTFDSPKPLLPSYLAVPSAGIIAASAAEAAGSGVLQPEQIIGTGPFKLDRWDSGVELVLTAFTDYTPVDAPSSGHAGQKFAGVAEIVFRPVLDESARLAGLQSGQYHYVESLPPDQLQVIQAVEGAEIAPRIVGNVAAYLNTQDSAVNTPEMRRALLVALDMDAIGAALGPDELWNLSPTIPSSTNRFASDVGAEDWNAKDPDRARDWARAAGYNGETITMISTSSPSTYRMAVMLEEQLKAAGFAVDLQVMETAVMQERRGQAGGWDIAMGQINNVADASQLSPLSCGNTVGAYCSEEMNAVIKAFTEAAEDELKAAHEEIQRLYYRDLPFIKGPEISDLNAVYGVTGFDPTQLNVTGLWNTSLVN